MNTRRIEKLKLTSKRTLTILELIEKGQSLKFIIEVTGATRQLVEYYIKITK